MNDKDEAIRQVRRYVEKGKLKLVLSQKLSSEYGRSNKVLKLFRMYDKEGFTKSIPDDECNKAREGLEKLKNKVIFKSDDLDTLALAKAAKVKLLVTGDDYLTDDFKNSQIIGGSVYRYKKHRHLLDENECSD